MITDKNNKKWRVIAFTPAGRKSYLEILKKYIDKEDLIDEWQLWLNTGNKEDIDYINSIENEKIKVKKIDGITEQDNYRIYEFYKYLDDKDAIYIRLDDDIVYIHPDAIKNLLKCRLENEEPFVVFANIVNNAVISNIHQRIGVLGKEYGEVSKNRFDQINFKNLDFAKQIHTTFINNYKNPEKYYFENEKINCDFSINCFAIFGKDIGVVERDEELYFSFNQPNKLGRHNLICGNALVVHYAFHTQREALNNYPEIINFYKNICQM